MKLLVIVLAALPLQAQALTLNCSHTGGFQTTTKNGRTETKRQDDPSTMTVGLDLANKTLAIEVLGEYNITSVASVEIVAGERSILGRVEHSMIWALNGVTGELRADSRFNSRYDQTYSTSTYQCEAAKAKF